MKLKIIIWIIRILVGGLMIFAGINKLMNGAGEEEHLIKIYDLLGDDLMLAASMAEVGGGIALFVPPVSSYAAYLLIIIMLVAAGTSAIVSGAGSAIVPIVLIVVLLGLVLLQRLDEV